MSIDKKIVSNVADLAKLKLNDSDLETISKELSNVLTWIESLNEVDTSSVEPIANIIGQKLSFREDEVTDGNFDVVVANIAANVLITLAETLVATVAENGIIITSGVLKTRIKDVISAFEFAGGEVRSTRQIEDWTTTLIARAR